MGNFRGIICLRSILSFAIMGIGFHYLIEPFAEQKVENIRENVLYFITLMLVLALLVDCVISALFRTPILY